MRKLLFYEIKKLIFRREGLVIILMLLIYLMVSTSINLYQTTTSLPSGDIRGLEAVKTLRKSQGAQVGYLTPQRITGIIETYQRLRTKAYNLDANGELLDLVYINQWLPYQEIETIICRVYSPTGDFDPYMLGELTPQDGADFYKHFQNKTLKPLYYDYHLGWLTMIQNLWIHGIVLTLCMAILCSTIFAGEYESGMAPILKCAKNGIQTLHKEKVLSAFHVVTVCFIAYMGLYILAIWTLYGFEGYGVSLQVVATFSPFKINLAQAVGLSLLCSYIGYLTLLSMVLYLSKKLKHSLATTVIAVAFLVVPMFIPPSDQQSLLRHIWHLWPNNLMNARELLDQSPLNLCIGIAAQLILIPLMIKGSSWGRNSFAP